MYVFTSCFKDAGTDNSFRQDRIKWILFFFSRGSIPLLPPAMERLPLSVLMEWPTLFIMVLLGKEHGYLH